MNASAAYRDLGFFFDEIVAWIHAVQRGKHAGCTSADTATPDRSWYRYADRLLLPHCWTAIQVNLLNRFGNNLLSNVASGDARFPTQCSELPVVVSRFLPVTVLLLVHTMLHTTRHVLTVLLAGFSGLVNTLLKPPRPVHAESSLPPCVMSRWTYLILPLLMHRMHIYTRSNCCPGRRILDFGTTKVLLVGKILHPKRTCVRSLRKLGASDRAFIVMNRICTL